MAIHASELKFGSRELHWRFWSRAVPCRVNITTKACQLVVRCVSVHSKFPVKRSGKSDDRPDELGPRAERGFGSRCHGELLRPII